MYAAIHGESFVKDKPDSRSMATTHSQCVQEPEENTKYLNQDGCSAGRKRNLSYLSQPVSRENSVILTNAYHC
jgi:hypothetical protein